MFSRLWPKMKDGPGTRPGEAAGTSNEAVWIGPQLAKTQRANDAHKIAP